MVGRRPIVALGQQDAMVEEEMYGYVVCALEGKLRGRAAEF